MRTVQLALIITAATILVGNLVWTYLDHEHFRSGRAFAINMLSFTLSMISVVINQ